MDTTGMDYNNIIIHSYTVVNTEHACINTLINMRVLITRDKMMTYNNMLIWKKLCSESERGQCGLVESVATAVFLLSTDT